MNDYKTVATIVSNSI